jgi:hypothetical protein
MFNNALAQEATSSSHNPRSFSGTPVQPPFGSESIYLAAYVSNDPINAADPTGTTCASVGRQANGAPAFNCRIDSVATVKERGGRYTITAVRPVGSGDGRRFDAFNARYTETTNRLASEAHADPNRTVTVRSFGGNREGSFTTSPGNMARELAARHFAYATDGPAGAAMSTSGGPGMGQGAVTYVYSDGLKAGPAGIAHDGGLHGSRDEVAGGLQTPRSELGRSLNDAHQRPYEDAACAALGGKKC